MRDDHVGETAGTPVVSGMADLSGTVVADRYRLTAALGQGAMANVYRAVDDRLDREVAVKLFHPGQEASVRARFGAEAQALARLSHPGLVGIYDAGVEGDRPYLVMQLVEGETLRERLLAGPLDPDAVVLLGARLAMALAHVHANGVVHRDIKPSNIVLDPNGSPHLADFGIALLLDAARMTGSNEIMGTAAYLSPEQILGVDVAAAADVYSLGLVLLECLTGELEYPGVSKVESALARLHRSPRMPDGISPVLAELLTAMTARKPEDRPAAGDCAAWFWAVREHSGVSNRAVRLAAARWLAPKRRLPDSRVQAPLFSGWRRFAIAGSALALAVMASTWLFTSLLPQVTPEPPSIQAVPPPAPAPSSGAPTVGVEADDPPMHIAAAMDTAGHGHSRPQAPVAAVTTAQRPQDVLVIASTLFGPKPDPAAGGTIPPSNPALDNGPGSTSDNEQPPITSPQSGTGPGDPPTGDPVGGPASNPSDPGPSSVPDTSTPPTDTEDSTDSTSADPSTDSQPNTVRNVPQQPASTQPPSGTDDSAGTEAPAGTENSDGSAGSDGSGEPAGSTVWVDW